MPAVKVNHSAVNTGADERYLENPDMNEPPKREEN
jgi:hypothetical protein